MDEILADRLSGIEMDNRSVPANNPVDSGYALDGHTSDLDSTVTSKAVVGQYEKKSATIGKKRSNSLAMKNPTAKSPKTSGNPAKKVGRPKTSRDKSPAKKAVTTTVKSPAKKAVTPKVKSPAKKAFATKVKSQVKKTGSTKDAKPKKTSKIVGVKEQNAKTSAKSPKKK